MKNGLYIYNAEDLLNRGCHVTVRLKETAKSFRLDLVESTLPYPAYGIDSVFEKTGSLAIRKDGSPHALRFVEDSFVLYPYRKGMPFVFDYIGE